MKVVFTIGLLLLNFCGWTQTLSHGEYFFDADPGQGNGLTFGVTPGAAINQTFNISTASLAEGFHTLNARVRSNTGIWSLFTSRTFYIAPTPAVPVPASQIVVAEFFFDTDPGIGNGTSVSFVSSSPISFPMNIPVASLSHGFHTINVRVKDDHGHWSLFGQRTFYIVPPVTVAGPSSTIQRAEYFFDSDPGVGNATVLPITSGALQNNLFPLDVSNLTPGFHRVGIRYRDNQNRWSHFSNRTFYIIPGNLLPSSAITQVEYFIDTSPSLNSSLNGTGVSVVPGATIDQDIFIDLSGVPSGTHTLYVRAKDNKGFWSTVSQGDFTILNCTPPAAPIASGVSRCGAGTLTLVASGASASHQYRWYEDGTTGTVLFTGAAFETPVLSASRNYFVNIFDPVSLCESNRVSVAASIILSAKPIVNPSGLISFCEGNSIILSAPAGFQQYLWSTGEVTRQIFVNTTGKYSVQVGDGNCLSPASDTTEVSVIGGFTKPTVNASGPLSFCSGGSVILSAPSGFSKYLWSTGETTPQILVTTTGNYSVKIGNGSCLSAASDNVAISVVGIPARPAINSSGPLTFCEGGSVVLSAPSGFSKYNWSSGETTRQILVNAAGKYSVQTGEGSCFSPASDTVEVSVVNVPAKPVVIVTGNTTLCGTGTVNLSGPSGFNYLWSNGEVTQSISTSASGVYTLRVSTGANCLSVSSDPTVVTVLTPPCGAVAVNQPPTIDNSPLASHIEGVLSLDLTTIITDTDANLDFATLRLLTSQTARGASAVIDASYNLVVDYSGLPFTGTDRLTIEICDLAGACVQQVLDIEVVGSVLVYNGISPDGDGKNDFLLLKYVDVVDGAGKNKVTIFNRWGDVVFEIFDYDNRDRMFYGQGNNGNELPSGTYFYKVEFSGGLQPLTGFLTLKR